MSHPAGVDPARHDMEVAAARRRVSSPASTGLLILRLGFGGLLFLHGLQAALNLNAVRVMVEQGDVPFPIATSLAAWLTAVGEMGLGVLVFFGLATRVAGGLVAVLMGLIYASVWVPKGHLLDMSQVLGVAGQGALTIGIVGLALVFTGPGRFALDSGFRRDEDEDDGSEPPAEPIQRRGSPDDRPQLGTGRQSGGAPGPGQESARPPGARPPGARRPAKSPDSGRPLPEDPTTWTDEDIGRL